MICKLFFKSFFKPNIFKKRKKKLFLKNILINLFFFKSLVRFCKFSFYFFKKKSSVINILRAPSRHKKFMHQYISESFYLNINLIFSNTSVKYASISNYIKLFNVLTRLFTALNSNMLTQTKISVSFLTSFSSFLNFKLF